MLTERYDQMLRKIVEMVPDEQLQEDLEKYRQRAIELGGTDAKIITADAVVIDERVRAKCIHPKCRMYGTNINCPPHAMDLELMKKIVNNFQYAIFLMLKVPPEMVAGPEAMKKGLPNRSLVKGYEIISKIEAEAHSDGYYLAVAFSTGPCKAGFCPDIECSALVPGQPCRHALRARGSISGAGIDAYKMATRVGWDVYPIGVSTDPSSVPHGTIMGIVLIYLNII